METKFETKFIKLSGIVFLSIALSACVMAPVRPIGYRTTTSTDVMPTYVNGQYVGEQPGNTVVETATPVYTTPVYTTPVYTYPYYAPAYIDPWYSGVGIGIGINYSRGCCWRGGGRGWHGGWYRGHRGWRR